VSRRESPSLGTSPDLDAPTHPGVLTSVSPRAGGPEHLPFFIAALMSEGGQEYSLSPCFPDSACLTGATSSSFSNAQEKFCS
jgi:hypothetical protein